MYRAKGRAAIYMHIIRLLFVSNRFVFSDNVPLFFSAVHVHFPPNLPHSPFATEMKSILLTLSQGTSRQSGIIRISIASTTICMRINPNNKLSILVFVQKLRSMRHSRNRCHFRFFTTRTASRPFSTNKLESENARIDNTINHKFHRIYSHSHFGLISFAFFPLNVQRTLSHFFLCAPVV